MFIDNHEKCLIPIYDILLLFKIIATMTRASPIRETAKGIVFIAINMFTPVAIININPKTARINAY